MLDLADGSRVDICCRLTVDAEAGEIIVDYAGTSEASRWGINVVKNYTHAYTTFTVRSVLSPDIPNNHGSLGPIKVEAPEGSIVNAVPPQPGTARHVVGMPGALRKHSLRYDPKRRWPRAGAVHQVNVPPRRQPFITAMFTYAGGVGARASKPGLDACSYPTGVSAVPIEVVEASAPIRFHQKALRADSGGKGAQPGGRGQVIEFSVATDQSWQLNAVTSRLEEPPQGVFGGEPGDWVHSWSTATPSRRRNASLSGDVVRLELPGGGGYGEPEPT